jgi:hypothetical protein
MKRPRRRFLHLAAGPPVAMPASPRIADGTIALARAWRTTDRMSAAEPRR